MPNRSPSVARQLAAATLLAILAGSAGPALAQNAEVQPAPQRAPTPYAPAQPGGQRTPAIVAMPAAPTRGGMASSPAMTPAEPARPPAPAATAGSATPLNGGGSGGGGGY